MVLTIDERRSNPEKNPYKSVIEQIFDFLDKHTGDEDKIFLSFRSGVHMTMVNPKNEYNTPTGIYVYPYKGYADAILDKYRGELDVDFSKLFPYLGSGGGNYIYMFCLKSVNGVVTTDTDPDILDGYMQKAATLLGLPANAGSILGGTHDDVVEFLIDFLKVDPDNVSQGNVLATHRFSDEQMRLYSLIMFYRYYLIRQYHYIFRRYSPHRDTTTGLFWVALHTMVETVYGQKAVPNRFASICRQIGIDGFIDYGTGYIHTNEPTQGVLFKGRSILKDYAVIDRRKNQERYYVNRTPKSTVQHTVAEKFLTKENWSYADSLTYLKRFPEIPYITKFYAKQFEALAKKEMRSIEISMIFDKVLRMKVDNPDRLLPELAAFAHSIQTLPTIVITSETRSFIVEQALALLKPIVKDLTKHTYNSNSPLYDLCNRFAKLNFPSVSAPVGKMILEYIKKRSNPTFAIDLFNTVIPTDILNKADYLEWILEFIEKNFKKLLGSDNTGYFVTMFLQMEYLEASPSDMLLYMRKLLVETFTNESIGLYSQVENRIREDKTYENFIEFIVNRFDFNTETTRFLIKELFQDTELESMFDDRVSKINDDTVQEARSNSDKNEYKPAARQVYEFYEKYRNTPELLYVSFRGGENMTMINPYNTFDTPTGVYVYPVKNYLEQQIIDKKNDYSVEYEVPFRGDLSYLYLFKLKSLDGIFSQVTIDRATFVGKYLVQILKMAGLSQDQADAFLQMNANEFGLHADDLNGPYAPKYLYELMHGPVFRYLHNPDLLRLKYNPKATGDVVDIWLFLHQAAEVWYGPSRKTNYAMPSLCRKLGINGFVDWGDGYIHRNEPFQGVFFRGRSILDDYATVKRDMTGDEFGKTGGRQVSKLIADMVANPTYESVRVVLDKIDCSRVPFPTLQKVIASIADAFTEGESDESQIREFVSRVISQITDDIQMIQALSEFRNSFEYTRELADFDVMFSAQAHENIMNFLKRLDLQEIVRQKYFARLSRAFGFLNQAKHSVDYVGKIPFYILNRDGLKTNSIFLLVSVLPEQDRQNVYQIIEDRIMKGADGPFEDPDGTFANLDMIFGGLKMLARPINTLLSAIRERFFRRLVTTDTSFLEQLANVAQYYIEGFRNFDDAELITVLKMDFYTEAQSMIDYYLIDKSSIKGSHRESGFARQMDQIGLSQEILAYLDSVFNKLYADHVAKFSDSNVNEARSNPDKNKYHSVADQIVSFVEKHKNNPQTIFLSFRSGQHVTNINRNNVYDTPTGVYVYPYYKFLEDRVEDSIRGELDINFKYIVPYQGEQPYIYLFNLKSLEGVVTSETTQDVVDEYIGKLCDVYKINRQMTKFEPGQTDDMKEFAWKEHDPQTVRMAIFVGMFYTDPSFLWVDFPKSTVTPAAKLWNFLHIFVDKMGIGRRVNNAMPSLCRKLGINGFVDYGTGFIHSNEPFQGVFFRGYTLFDDYKIVDRSHLSNNRTEKEYVDRNTQLTADALLKRGTKSALLMYIKNFLDLKHYDSAFSFLRSFLASITETGPIQKDADRTLIMQRFFEKISDAPLQYYFRVIVQILVYYPAMRSYIDDSVRLHLLKQFKENPEFISANINTIDKMFTEMDWDKEYLSYTDDLEIVMWLGELASNIDKAVITGKQLEKLIEKSDQVRIFNFETICIATRKDGRGTYLKFVNELFPKLIESSYEDQYKRKMNSLIERMSMDVYRVDVLHRPSDEQLATTLYNRFLDTNTHTLTYSAYSVQPFELEKHLVSTLVALALAKNTSTVNESQFSYRELDRQQQSNLYQLFKSAYEKNGLQSWSQDKFAQRAWNWTFFGSPEQGFVAVRRQRGDLLKMTGMAGDVKGIMSGLGEMIATGEPIWGMMDKRFVGILVQRYDFVSPPGWLLKIILKLIPSSAFGGTDFDVNSDGSITLKYEDVGDARKYFVANRQYYRTLLSMDNPLMDKIPFLARKALNKFIQTVI